jgi:hypothetical protein
VWFGAFFAAERLLPAAPRPAPLDEPGRGGGGLRLARNLGLWLVNAAISPLIVVPVSLLASEIALAWRPEAWQGWPALLVDIVVLDFLIYWWHLANHRVPLSSMPRRRSGFISAKCCCRQRRGPRSSSCWAFRSFPSSSSRRCC